MRELVVIFNREYFGVFGNFRICIKNGMEQNKAFVILSLNYKRLHESKGANFSFFTVFDCIEQRFALNFVWGMNALPWKHWEW